MEAGVRHGGLDAADPRAQREDHRQRPDEMRCDGVHQPAAFDGRLPGDPDVGLREVAQSAVGEFRAPAARARGEVAAFDEGDREPAAGRVQSDAGAGESTADDDDVGDIRRGGRQVAFALSGVEGRGIRCGVGAESRRGRGAVICIGGGHSRPFWHDAVPVCVRRSVLSRSHCD